MRRKVGLMPKKAMPSMPSQYAKGDIKPSKGISAAVKAKPSTPAPRAAVMPSRAATDYAKMTARPSGGAKAAVMPKKAMPVARKATPATPAKKAAVMPSAISMMISRKPKKMK